MESIVNSTTRIVSLEVAYDEPWTEILVENILPEDVTTELVLNNVPLLKIDSRTSFVFGCALHCYFVYSYLYGHMSNQIPRKLFETA